MHVTAYQPNLHQDMLISWFKQWKMPIDDIEMLPDSGLIIENICAVFLYKTNSSICLVESLICNKDVALAIRQEGLNIIIGAIIKLAQESGFKQIISLVENPKVIQRALDFKYTISKDKFHIMIRRI